MVEFYWGQDNIVEIICWVELILPVI